MFNHLVQMESKDLQLKLAKKEISYDSDEVQFFIPVIVTDECLDWLELMIQNTVDDVDKSILLHFIDHVRSIRKTNQDRLHETLIDNLKKGLDEL